MKKNILQKIIKEKKKWIKKEKKKNPLHILLKQQMPKVRNFYKCFNQSNPVFILECKKSSPSNGILRKNFNLKEIIKVYKKYASIVSVVTEEKYFKGSLKNMLKVRKLCKIPILCKDFFISKYQIHSARYFGADAILLILSILSNSKYKKLATIAKKKKLGILTEVNSIHEMKRAILLKAKVIGINNRNLHDLTVDKNKTKIISKLAPKNVKLVSESGFQSNKEIKKFKKTVNGFLIGSILMKQKNLSLAVRKIIYGNNKICGLTRIKDAKNAEKKGAVYGGLIFCPNSIRFISLKKAKKIVSSTNLLYVGVFCNEKIKKIISFSKKIPFYAIQLHGEEDNKYISKLKKKINEKIKIWKAIKIKKKIILPKSKFINCYLLDNKKGGSGKQFDWNIIKKKTPRKVFLAGGLNKKNLKKALSFNFFGLDFNSGVEKKPGKKDKKKISEIFKQLKKY